MLDDDSLPRQLASFPCTRCSCFLCNTGNDHLSCQQVGASAAVLDSCDPSCCFWTMASVDKLFVENTLEMIDRKSVV